MQPIPNMIGIAAAHRDSDRTSAERYLLRRWTGVTVPLIERVPTHE